MNEEKTIEKILRMKAVAVVGISDKPERAGHFVPKYLASRGYDVIPVNPNISSWEGRKCFPDLKSIGKPVEVVDVFRKPEAVPDIVKEAMAIKAKAIWLQEGVVNVKAAQEAESAGLVVVMDRCMMKESQKRSPL